MGLFDPDFPSSQAFEHIDSTLNANEDDRKEAIKRGDAIFAITLKNEAGKQESWYIDLKKEGKVGKGTAPEGHKAHDGDFDKLVKGTAKAQTLFMSGKLKVRGDVMKATKLETVIGQAKAKL